nr:MAG TPA: hypothetical protein [Caudoviricetes sp.]
MNFETSDIILTSIFPENTSAMRWKQGNWKTFKNN